MQSALRGIGLASKCKAALRATSNCGGRSGGRGFLPIRLQENENAASGPFTLKAKVQMLLLFQMPTFWSRRRTLEGSLDRTRMETQTMVESLSIVFHKRNKKLTRSWPLDWKNCFGQGIKWDAPSSFGLWAWPLEASHFQVERPWKFMAKGLDVRLGLWRLHTMPDQRLRFLYFIGYFQPISLDSTKFGHTGGSHPLMFCNHVR
jgi:hypothetical protein